MYLLSLARDFLKEHPEIYVDQSDKSKVTVVMLEKWYMDKVKALLRNKDVYRPILDSSMESLVRKNLSLLQMCADEGFLSHNEVNKIACTESQLANFYGKVKTHKEDFPIRPIIAQVDFPGQRITQILKTILSRMFSDDPFDVKNSDSLRTILINTKLKPYDRLYTLDVVDMFTNIPVEEVIPLIKLRFSSSFTKMSQGLFFKLLDFVAWVSNEFKFFDLIFKQIKGLPMGNGISPILAGIYTSQHLFANLMLNHPPTLIKKYVDDILIITNPENAARLVGDLNKPTSLKFKLTEEDPDECSINYLNMTIFRKDDYLVTKWYSKPYSSGRLIDWFSGHTKDMVKNVDVNQVCRMFALSDPIFYDDIGFIARDMLWKNSFPDAVINNILKNGKNKTPAQEHAALQYIGVEVDNYLLSSLKQELRNSSNG